MEIPAADNYEKAFEHAKTSLEDLQSQTGSLLKRDVRESAKHHAELQNLSKDEAKQLNDELFSVFF